MAKTTTKSKSNAAAAWKGTRAMRKTPAKKAPPPKRAPRTPKPSRVEEALEVMNAPAPEMQPEATAQKAEAATPGNVAGKARAIIVEACSRPEGATSKELFAATGWKYASWSHQLKLAAKVTGWTSSIGRRPGHPTTTVYFLLPPTA